MKLYSLTLLFALFFATAQAQDTEKEITTTLQSATVFFSGAQLERTGSIPLPKGRSELKVVNLSPDIDPESIRIKAGVKCRILSVRHQLNYMKALENSEQEKDLTARLETLKLQGEELKTEEEAIKTKREFLAVNDQIVSKEKGVSPADLREFTQFYANENYQVDKDLLAIKRKLKSNLDEERKIRDQLSTIRTNKGLRSSEIYISVDADQALTAKFEITYFMPEAGWEPSYDIRYTNALKPLEIVHKASIKQSSGVDWKKVKLTLSNANPTQSGQYQSLSPYYLNFQQYYAQKPRDSYSQQPYQVQSQDVSDALQGRMAGVSVQSKSYRKAKPSYLVDGVLCQKDPKLRPDEIESMEVIKDNSAKIAQGVQVEGDLIVIRTKQRLTTTSTSLASSTSSTQVEFVVASPYTIVSDQKSITIDMKTDLVPASYVYRAVPKLEKEAFLIAKIPDWEKVGLLSGSINIYAENTYVGQSQLDIQAVSDTLNISIGRDKNIVVKREQRNNFNSSQLIGSKRIEQRNWDISVRSLKDKAITLEIFDQLPVSTEKSIELTVLQITGAQHNAVTGELKWIMQLKPQETSKLNLSYEVKYPKDEKINLDN